MKKESWWRETVQIPPTSHMIFEPTPNICSPLKVNIKFKKFLLTTRLHLTSFLLLAAIVSETIYEN